MRQSASEVGLSSPRPWFAVRVKSNLERAVSSALGGRGYESFLPLYRSVRNWPSRTRIVELPLFAGYVFCQLDPLDRLPILTVPGVVHIVGLGKVPLPVAPEEIEAIRAITNSPLFAEPWPFVGSGTRVRLVQGPLAGLEGIIVEVLKNCRLVASVTLLQRSVSVEIDRTWVQPLGPKPNTSIDGNRDAFVLPATAQLNRSDLVPSRALSGFQRRK